MLKLAERIVLSFYTGVRVSAAQRRTTFSGSGVDDLIILTRRNIDDPGRPHAPGTILSTATSLWILSTATSLQMYQILMS